MPIIALLLATAASIALSMTPGLDTFIYPIKLLVTFVHELCHAFAALLTGGGVQSIAIHHDFSGETYTYGGIEFIVSSAGYVGTVLVGLLGIKMVKWNHSQVLMQIYAAALIVAVYYTLVGASGFGMVWGLIMAAVAWAVAMYMHKSAVDLVASFVSIQMLLNAFYDLKVLFNLSGTGVATDALNMQNSTGIPAVFWAVLWMAISVFATYRAFAK